MKKILLFLLAIATGIGVNAQVCGTYTLDMQDSFGDGWNGASLAITANGTPVTGSPFSITGASGSATFSTNVGDAIEVTFTSGSFDGEITYQLIDESAVTILSDDVTPGVVYTGTACPPPPVCGTYTLDMQDSFGDGWNGASLAITANGTPVTGSPFSIAGASGSATFSTNVGDAIEVTFTSGSFDGEITYQLIDESAVTILSDDVTPGVVYTGTACPPPPVGGTCGAFTLDMQDSFGDGWNGASLAITANGTPVTGSPFSITGSTGSATFSTNVNDAIEVTFTSGSFDGEITYQLIDESAVTVLSNDVTPGVVYTGTACPPPPVCGTYTLDMQDSFGDGWNGASLAITANGTPVTGSPFSIAGASGSATFSTNVGDAIEVTFTSGSFDGEITYQLIDESAVTVLSNDVTPGVVYTGTACPPPPVGGTCGAFTLDMQDSFGDGWNGASLAITANGTPVTGSPFSITGSTGSATFSTNVNDAIEVTFTSGSFDGEITYQLIDESAVTVLSDDVTPGVVYTGTACLSCTYTLDMQDSFGDGWNGASVAITSAGTPVAGSPFSITGSTGSATFTVSGGELLELTFTSGSFDTEITYQLIDPNATTIFSDGPSPTIGLAYSTNTCPTCEAPTVLTMGTITANSADFSWTASGSASNGYNWEIRPAGGGAAVVSGSTVGVSDVSGATLMSGTPYELFVQSDCGADSSAFASLAFSTPIGNDDCAGAIPLDVNTDLTCTLTTSFINTGATFSAAEGAPSGACSDGDPAPLDVWFTAVVPAGGEILFEFLSVPGFSSIVELYTGVCGSLVPLAPVNCSNNTTRLFTGLTPGSTVYFRVWDFGSDQFGSSEICLQGTNCSGPTATVTVVDDCANSQFSIDIDVTDMGSSASYSVEDGAATVLGTITGTGTTTVGPFASGAVVDITLVHDSDNACNATATGVTFTCPPVNDDCADAIPVFGGYSITGFSTNGATVEASDPTTCTFNDVTAVWFEYTPSCNTDVIVNTCGSSYDTNLSIWDDCSYTNEIACDDDDFFNVGPCGGAGFTSAVQFTATGGVTYYIRIGGFNGQTGDISFELQELTVCPCTQNVWTGANSTAWSDDLNWTCGVAPVNDCASGTGSDVAIVPAGSSVTPVVTGTQGAASLSVGAGSSITIDGTLQVCGNVSHSGNSLTGAGDLELNGSAGQMLSGNGAFGTVELVNAAGATVMAGAALSVDSALILTTGTFTNAGSFSLNSDSGGTAYLDDFTGSGTYAGDLTANRYITAGVGLGQRYFGSAVANSVVSGLDNTYGPGVYPMNDYIMPIATCDPDSIMPASPYSNLLQYDEDEPTFCTQSGWFALNANVAALTPGRGYSGWVNDGSVISVTGAPNTGTQDYGAPGGLSNTPANVQAQGFHVLSNPYPSPLYVDSVTSGTGLTSVQYYVGSSGPWSGSFQPAIVYGTTIPVMQGFSASSNGSGTLNLDNVDRVASTNGFFSKSNNWFDYRLDVEISIGGAGDITYVYYNDVATAQFDEVGDCEKRQSVAGKPTLYTRNSGKIMSLNGLHLNDLGTSIPMGLIAPGVEMATFSFSGMDDFPANTTIYVEDKVMGTFHNVADGDYTFEADPAQNGTDRFEIHFVLPASFNLVEATCDNTNGAIVENTADGRLFDVINEGTIISNGELDGSANELAAGDYTIEVFDQFGGSQSYDFTVEEVIPVTAGIISSSSAVEVGESIDFEFNGADANDFEWTINGQVIAQTELVTYQFNTPGEFVVEVYAANDQCDAIASQIVEVAEKSTSIVEVGNGSLAIYSNAGNVILNFENINQGEVNASIYNLLGQEVTSVNVESSGKQTIQNANWADGYYIVKVQIGEVMVNETVLLTK